MNTKSIIITLFLMAMPFGVNAQQLVIKSFEFSPSDIIASQDIRTDLTGVACAIVKIHILEGVDRVEGNVIGNIVDRGVEKWVYMTEGTKKMRVYSQNHLPIEIDFQDFGIRSLASKCVYKLVLVDPEDPFDVLNIGIRGGANFATASIDEEGVSMTTMFHLGLSFDYRLTKSFGFSTGLFYSVKGYKESNLDVVDLKATAHYVELPIQATYYIMPSETVRIQIQAGPYVAYGLSGSIKSDHPLTDLEFFNIYERFDYGIQAGAGVLISNHYYIGAHYQLGLTDSKNRNIGISIGYNF